MIFFNVVMLLGTLNTKQRHIRVFPCYEFCRYSIVLVRFKVYIHPEPWKHPDMFT